MPPLTLEQVLARSMRLPQRRATRAAGLFGPPSSAVGVSGEGSGGAALSPRLSIQRSGALLRNSADLLTFLRAARRVSAWEEALRAFSSATAAPAPAVSATAAHVTALLDALAAAGQWRRLLSHAQYFGADFPAVLTHAVALLLARGRETGDAAREVVAAVLAVVPSDPNTTAPSADMPVYEAALLFLRHGTVRPDELSVECFNAILAACEDAKDWQAALRVVRGMGPNPLQGWTAQGEVRQDGDRRSSSSLGLVRDGGDSSSSSSSSSSPAKPDEGSSAPVPLASPPSPDVVSYATLIATLEQAGKDGIAAQVLGRLPPLEKEEITASYAALIYVWSNQVYNKNRQRNR